MGLLKTKEERELLRQQKEEVARQEEEAARQEKEAAKQAEIQKEQAKRDELMQLSEKELLVEILLQLKDVNDHLSYMEIVMPTN